MIWHYDVHRKLGETLYFWRLGFFPTYRQEDTIAAVRAVFNNYGVKSAVCYELFGPHDLLLRVWLPADADFAEFQQALVDDLTPLDLNMCDPFQVSHTIRHWLFSPVNGEIPRPLDDDIEDLTEADIRDVEAMRVSEQRLNDLEQKKLVKAFANSRETTDPSNPGTKFAVVVTGDPRLTTAQHRQFGTILTQKLDGAKRVKQHSLYAGWGFGHFLIMGCVKDAPLFALTEDLLSEINAADIHNYFNARTYTHVSGLRDFVLLRESLTEVIPRTDDQPAADEEEPYEEPRRRDADDDGPPVVGGTFAGRFHVVRHLGQGGFSSVFEVVDELEEERRALKAFSSGDPSAVRREIGFLRRVDHPNVMKVFWADLTPRGVWYMVSELVEGKSLESYIRGSDRLDDQAAIKAELELLSALRAIHPDERRIAELRSGELKPEEFAELQELQDAGFVHRDVKPSNIMLSPTGVKLVDFNIASHAGDPVRTMSGTPRYQPPDGPLDSWDVTTDLFAAGVVLYELLCQAHPYGNEIIFGDEPRDPREMRPDLSPALANFLLKACAPTAERRFRSASEMSDALKEAVRDATVDAHAGDPVVGKRLRERRRAADFSLETLAERANIEPEVLDQIESGKLSPTLWQTRQIAAALDMTLTRLLDSDG